MDEGTILSSDDQPVIGSPEYAQMAAKRDAYMSMVGGYLWLANMTMWYLAYAAGQLARYLTNPGPSHFRAAVRVLIYLRDGGPRPLVLAPNATRGLDTYVDSSWAARFSVSGCLVFYHGCLIHWFSKMQKSVSLSSAEAEYFGAMMAARDLVWLRDLLVDLRIVLGVASVMWSDSKSAVDMAFDPVAFKQTKHILRAAEFLRDLVAREVLVLRHVPGRVMLADLLTKAVARPIFLELLRLFDRYPIDGAVCPSSPPSRASSAPAPAPPSGPPPSEPPPSPPPSPPSSRPESPVSVPRQVIKPRSFASWRRIIVPSQPMWAAPIAAPPPPPPQLGDGARSSA